MNQTFIPFHQVQLTDDFWHNRQRINEEATLQAVYDRFQETGRFAALDFAYRPGDPNPPHIFWDSDVAKWMEGAAYMLRQHRDPALEELMDGLIDRIVRHQREDGYFNTYFQQIAPEEIFRHRPRHELYCAGHLIEAAVAYRQATGKDRFLSAMCRYADCIDRVFRVERSAGFTTPGHEEIEIALLRLWEETGEERYLTLARFFIDQRGTGEEAENEAHRRCYSQSHLPVREQTTAEGHAVRAVYLYTAMAALARIDGDQALKDACLKIFDNIVNRRMYITGGIGSAALGEAFTVDYDLPNLTAYSESCAAIGLMLFCRQLQCMDADSRYADTIERVMYNGFLSAVSLDGTSFFYLNPLEITPQLLERDVSVCKGGRRLPITQRRKVFSCSCCPPNIVRMMPQLGGFLYSTDAETLYVHQYVQSRMEADGLTVTQETVYPSTGRITLTVTGNTRRTLALRKPFWCRSFTLTKDGKPAAFTQDRGYLYLEAERDMRLEIDFAMAVEVIQANPRVVEDCGRAAVMRGPIVYCAEGVDNGDGLRDVTLAAALNPEIVHSADYHCPTLRVDAWRREDFDALYTAGPVAYRPMRLRLIPYFAFANRGATEMVVWMNLMHSAPAHTPC
ncbi:MAG: glycoside hydrolase family 127 protein [Aristaeellaceae bacterium]